MRIFNSIFNSFFRTIGRILAYLAVGAVIVYVMSIAGCEKVKAYAYIRTVAPAGNFQPTSDSRIKNPANSWGVGIKPSYLVGYDPWIYDMGQYFSVSNVSGTYLSVTADYYIGISFNTADVAFLDSYLKSDRDPLKSTNLRCGLGSSYASGYSSIYAPSITNFSVTLTEAENPSGNNYHYTYHIKYNYFQQIQRVTGYSGNASCWFEREPSNALIAQINKIITGTTEFYYYNQTFNVNLSLDPNTAILDSIEGQNNTIIDQNNQTNQKLDETNSQLNNLNDNLTNSNSDEATNEAGNFFSGFTTDTFGLTSIITAPLNLITSITSSSCSPVGVPIPFVDKTLNLPCLRGIYEEHFGSFFTVYQTITFGIVAYWVIVRIFALVKDFKNPDHDEIEVLDL